MRPECVPLDEHATNSMKSNKCKDTKPELIVRKALREAGYPGYRLQWKIPGRPDICYPGRHIAIFVNGCFWHRCPHCHPSVPKHNHEFWIDKFEKNVERDRRNYEILRNNGWIVIVIWECEVKHDLSGAIDRIVSEIEKQDSFISLESI